MMFPRLTPLVRQMLITLVVIYVAELILQNWVNVPVFELLALSHGSLSPATLWQLFTYLLVTPTSPQYVLGFLIGLVFVWWILAPFEERYGAKRTLQLCAVAALSASLPALAVGHIAPGASEYPPLFGTGPVLLAGIAAFAYALRGMGTLSLFGAFSMKPIYVIWLALGISVLFFLASGNFVELTADLGAVGGGIGFIRYISRPRSGGRRKKPKKNGGGTPFRVVEGGRSSSTPPDKKWLNRVGYRLAGTYVNHSKGAIRPRLWISKANKGVAP